MDQERRPKRLAAQRVTSYADEPDADDDNYGHNYGGDERKAGRKAATGTRESKSARDPKRKKRGAEDEVAAVSAAGAKEANGDDSTTFHFDATGMEHAPTFDITIYPLWRNEGHFGDGELMCTRTNTQLLRGDERHETVKCGRAWQVHETTTPASGTWLTLEGNVAPGVRCTLSAFADKGGSFKTLILHDMDGGAHVGTRVARRAGQNCI